MLNTDSFLRTGIYTNSLSQTAKTNNVAFKGLPKIPYRLQSPYQDEFHATSTQIYIRKFLESIEEGAENDEEIISHMFLRSKGASETDMEAYRKFIQGIKTNIENTDKSFKNLIPTLLPRTVYRGIRGDAEDNRGISIILAAQKGDIIKPDLGYPFASSKESCAVDYARDLMDNASPETSVVMKIKLPAGVKVARDLEYSLNPLGPQNIVLPRGVSYEVLDKEVKDDITYITLKYTEADGLK